MGDLEEQLKGSKKVIEKLRALLLTPEPAVDFGQTGEQHTAQAFRFGAKLLNCKLTCQSAADVIEVVFGEL